MLHASTDKYGIGTNCSGRCKRRKNINLYENPMVGTSLIAQWLIIRLLTQGTWVPSLVWEDPTCCGAPKPVSHNYWVCALESASRNYWAHMPQLLKPERLEPVLHNKEKPLQWEAHALQRRLNAARKNKQTNYGGVSAWGSEQCELLERVWMNANVLHPEDAEILHVKIKCSSSMFWI